jgi:hypothetical protein
VEKVVKGTGRAAERVGWILAVNTTGEASKTGNHDSPKIFLRLLLQKHQTEKHRSR